MSDRRRRAVEFDRSSELADDGERSGISCVVIPGRIRANLASSFATADLAPGEIPAAKHPLDRVAELAVAAIGQIIAGRFDYIERATDLTGLCAGPARSIVTGTRGFIVRRSFPSDRGRYTAAIAEILVTGDDQDAWNRFALLREAAARGRLEAVIHDDRGSFQPDLKAFAVYREQPQDEHFWYVARLLLAPSEIIQWTNPFLEAPSGRED